MCQVRASFAWAPSLWSWDGCSTREGASHRIHPSVSPFHRGPVVFRRRCVGPATGPGQDCRAQARYRQLSGAAPRSTLAYVLLGLAVMTSVDRIAPSLSRCGLVATLLAVALTACAGNRAINEPGGTGGANDGGARTGGAPGTEGGSGTGGAPGSGGRAGSGGAGGTGSGGQGTAGGPGFFDAGMPNDAGCPALSSQLLYGEPGCGASTPAPRCLPAYTCIQNACSCDGKVISGCHAFPSAHAYVYPLGLMPDAGACDPDAPPPAN